MNPLPSYTLLIISLTGIFAAGGAVGYFIGKGNTPSPATLAEVNAANVGNSPDQWADQAFDRLAGDLELTTAQRTKVLPYLEATAENVFLERDRALLQMHLRLLEVHDALSREDILDEHQKTRLSQSREKLKTAILSRFPALLKSEEGLLPDP